MQECTTYVGLPEGITGIGFTGVRCRCKPANMGAGPNPDPVNPCMFLATELSLLLSMNLVSHARQLLANDLALSPFLWGF